MLLSSLSNSRKFCQLHAAAERDVPGLGEFAQLLYSMTLAHVDDFGRFPADGFTLKGEVLPRSVRPDEDFDLAVKAMVAVGLVAILNGADSPYMEYSRFWKKNQGGLCRRVRPHHCPETPSPSPAREWGNWPPDLADKYQKDARTASWQKHEEVPGKSEKIQEDQGNSVKVSEKSGSSPVGGREGRGLVGGEEGTEGTPATAGGAPKKAKKKARKKKPADPPGPNVYKWWLDLHDKLDRVRPADAEKDHAGAKRTGKWMIDNKLPEGLVKAALKEYLLDEDPYTTKGRCLALFPGKASEYVTALREEARQAPKWTAADQEMENRIAADEAAKKEKGGEISEAM